MVIKVVCCRATWLVVGIGAQIVAFFVVLSLDPSGLDRCEIVPSSAVLAAQRRAGEVGLIVALLCAVICVGSVAKRPVKPQSLGGAMGS